MSEWLNTLLRSAGLFILTLLLVRLIGKRLTSRPTFFDLVTGIAIGVIAAALSLNMVQNFTVGYCLGFDCIPSTVLPAGIKYKAVRDPSGQRIVLINHGSPEDSS